MTNKVQKIRKEIEMVVNRRLNLLNGDYFDLNKEADGFTNEIMDIIDSLQEEYASNVVKQKRRCLEEIAQTINPFIEEVVNQFNMKDDSITSKEIQYRGIGLKGDFGENIHRSDDEIIYILKEDKAVGLIIVRRTEFNNAEITMIKTEERFKTKQND